MEILSTTVLCKWHVPLGENLQTLFLIKVMSSPQHNETMFVEAPRKL